MPRAAPRPTKSPRASANIHFFLVHFRFRSDFASASNSGGRVRPANRSFITMSVRCKTLVQPWLLLLCCSGALSVVSASASDEQTETVLRKEIAELKAELKSCRARCTSTCTPLVHALTHTLALMHAHNPARTLATRACPVQRRHTKNKATQTVELHHLSTIEYRHYRPGGCCWVPACV